jgi:hypothetical protein
MDLLLFNDQHKLKQTMINLIIDFLKYTKSFQESKGFIKLQVSLSESKNLIEF